MKSSKIVRWCTYIGSKFKSAMIKSLEIPQKQYDNFPKCRPTDYKCRTMKHCPKCGQNDLEPGYKMQV